MDYYQGIVVEYLRSDRAIFVNPECTIQLKEGRMPAKNEFWYCDVVAIDLRHKTVFLCEVTYAVGMSNLIKRLKSWNDNWGGVCAALVRDCRIQSEWEVRPWVFVPEDFVKPLLEKMKQQVQGPDGLLAFKPRITTLESVQPWKFKFDHLDSMTDKSKSGIPEEMRS